MCRVTGDRHWCVHIGTLADPWVVGAEDYLVQDAEVEGCEEGPPERVGVAGVVLLPLKSVCALSFWLTRDNSPIHCGLFRRFFEDFEMGGMEMALVRIDLLWDSVEQMSVSLCARANWISLSGDCELGQEVRMGFHEVVEGSLPRF